MKKQKLLIRIETAYAKPVISKVKNLLWNKFEINPNVENFSFSDAPYQEVCFYYVSTGEVDNEITGQIKFGFGDVLEILPMD